jgi:hypothetical protein
MPASQRMTQKNKTTHQTYEALHTITHNIFYMTVVLYSEHATATNFRKTKMDVATEDVYMFLT